MNKDNPLFRMMQKHVKPATTPVVVNTPKVGETIDKMGNTVDLGGGLSQTLTLGVPSTIGGSSTNSVNPDAFSHKLIDGTPIQFPDEKNTLDSPKQALTSTSNSASMGAGMSEKASVQVKVPASMQLSPMAQRLMQTTKASVQAVAVAEDSGASPEYKPLVADGGIHELAAMNTDSLEPQMHVEKTINVKAEALTKASVLDSSESVRALCDKIDSMIEGDQMVSGPSLAVLRNSVMTLMMTLKSKPEYDSVIIDKDVRNVMTYIRSTRQESLDLREIKTTKKAVRAAKKESSGAVSAKNLKGMEAAFNKMMGLGPK